MNARFTTVPLKALSDEVRIRYSCFCYLNNLLSFAFLGESDLRISCLHVTRRFRHVLYSLAPEFPVINNVEPGVVFIELKVFLMILFLDFKGTVVNREFRSLHEGSLEITLTVLLITIKLKLLYRNVVSL